MGFFGIIALCVLLWLVVMLASSAANRAIRRQAGQEREDDEKRLRDKFEKLQERAKEDLAHSRAMEAERKKLEQQGFTRTEIMKKEQEEEQQRVRADTEAKKKEYLEKMQKSAGAAGGAPSAKPEQSVSAEKNSGSVAAARILLSSSPYSRRALIDELEADGFSEEDAVYGADSCGADWKEQAVRSAENELSFYRYSFEELVESLEEEGFTREQAEYGARQNGIG